MIGDISKLNDDFTRHCEDFYPSLRAELSTPDNQSLKTRDDDLIIKAVILENFIANLFPIKEQLEEIKTQSLLKKKLSDFKFKFVQKKCYRTYKKEEIAPDFKDPKLDKMPIGAFIDYVLGLEAPEPAIKHIAYKVHFEPDHNIFKMPKKLDFDHLIGDKFERKDGSMEAGYCLYCHKQEKDSCRTGFPNKTNPLDNKLDGCPLDQKISEMNYLYAEGRVIAALAVTMIDNPLAAVTGHRVCNDCIKSCIFQKQEPVDIPCIETDMVKDVLSLPYGAEIYYLLTRWNPLDNFLAKESMSGHALVVGLGPAGFALSYYLLREGHKVTAIDGMDIKPLDKAYFDPIKNWKKLVGKYEPQGFGGVCEYGITDRWDKTNLLLVRMILERFDRFKMSGNTKLLPTPHCDQLLREAATQKKTSELTDHNSWVSLHPLAMTINEAAENFDHIALCIGAGEPIKPEVKNTAAKGIYSAFTYLMKYNMQVDGWVPHQVGDDVRMQEPVLILGAGLTAMDCAMEAAKYSDNVSIIYRKSMRDCPAYKENHDELQVILDLGVKFIENTDLKSIEINEASNVISINNNIKSSQIIYAFSTYDNIIPGISKYKDKISYLGDVNPTYAGTVVKAIASAKDMYEEISKKLL